ncbi:MAG: response regulator [Beutenbergiaceae bacterium]
MTISVLLVDDQSLLRMGFRMVLEGEPDLSVVGEATDGSTAVSMAAALKPDVVLMDVRMPGMDGIAATERICREQPGTRVLILTTFDLDAYAFAGLQAGASGFLLKDTHPHELTAAIRTVNSGDAVVSPRVTRRILEMFAEQLPVSSEQVQDPNLSLLTPREHEVLLAVAAGYSNAEIADRLVVSEATIKTHVGKMLNKLGLRDRVQAVVFAYRSGLVRP